MIELASMQTVSTKTDSLEQSTSSVSNTATSRSCDLLCHDNGDGIVKDTLTKHEHVEGGVDIQGMEDGQRGYGIHG